MLEDRAVAYSSGRRTCKIVLAGEVRSGSANSAKKDDPDTKLVIGLSKPSDGPVSRCHKMDADVTGCHRCAKLQCLVATPT
jgi:hypothetical protein